MVGQIPGVNDESRATGIEHPDVVHLHVWDFGWASRAGCS
jgi:hypothetical protein